MADEIAKHLPQLVTNAQIQAIGSTRHVGPAVGDTATPDAGLQTPPPHEQHPQVNVREADLQFLR
eukprot:8115543-Pyramimonas_sp.AAC.1